MAAAGRFADSLAPRANASSYLDEAELTLTPAAAAASAASVAAAAAATEAAAARFHGFDELVEACLLRSGISQDHSSIDDRSTLAELSRISISTPRGGGGGSGGLGGGGGGGGGKSSFAGKSVESSVWASMGHPESHPLSMRVNERPAGRKSLEEGQLEYARNQV